MAKSIKAKLDLGINTIVDSIMVPDGFARVCDGLDLRSGSARAFSYPSTHHVINDYGVRNIWEYRGLWYESALNRAYHAEYVNGQSCIYFTEEGIGHVRPQKIINGYQADLGISRPAAQPLVSAYDTKYPASIEALITGSGGVQPPVASYRVAAMIGDAYMVPSEPFKIQIVTASTVELSWRGVKGATGYAVFGRTSGSEKLLVKTAATIFSWIDDGSTEESSDAASTYEELVSKTYVYTYYRRVGTVEDESGPSPLSIQSDPKTIPVVRRLPQYDGFYEGATVYDLSADNMSFSLPAYAVKSIVSFLTDQSETYTTMVTSTAHGMATGDTGTVNASIVGGPSTSRTTVTVPSALASPVVSHTGFPVGAGVAAGSYVYKFVSCRGYSGGAMAGNPAQSDATTVNVTVPALSDVSFSIDLYSPGTDSVIVYRNGVARDVIDVSSAATWTDTGAVNPSFGLYPQLPVSNETSTRVFTVPINYSTTGGFSWSIDFFILDRMEISLPTATTFTPQSGDILSFSGVSEYPDFNGIKKVLSVAGATVTLVMPSPGASSVTASIGTMSWIAGNGSYAGWRVYRAGDTAEFLRVADLSLDVDEFIDIVTTDNLGVAIPTAYEENGLYVVYDRAPSEMKRMVNHYGMRFGIVDSLVRWTPVGVPDAWPDVYYAAFPSRPIALKSFKNMLAVLCEDGLYGLAGNTASTISPAGPFSDLGCIAPFSAQASNYGLMWLSKTGVCISQDGVSARCLTSDRMPGRFFYAPSTTGSSGVIGTGVGWLLEPRQTVQFAESMREEEIDYRDFPVTEVAFDLPSGQEMTDIRSFFWDNRYTLFYSGTDAHARSGCISIDMSQPSLPVTTWPVKPVDVHVSQGGDLYMLLLPRPIMSVSFVVT